MRRLLLTYALFLAASIASAASQLYEGRVVDAKSGAAIPGATLTLPEKTTLADANGRFSLQGASDSIAVRAPGYRAARYTAAQMADLHGALPLQPFTPRALYLTVYGIGSKSLRGAALNLIHRGFANALVIDVKGDRGLIPYRTSVPLAQTSGARQLTTIPDLPGLLQSLHRDGIYAIARIVVFKDLPLATARPDLAVHRSDGSLFRDAEDLAWTDPFQKEVWNYNIAIAREAAQAGFDEIQFDYVRFPDVANRLRFARDPSQAARVEAIQGFLQEARQQLAPYNVFLAVDIFGYVCWNENDTGIGQQLEGVAKIADYLSPMLYPSCFQWGIPGYRDPVSYPYEIIRHSLDAARRRTGLPPIQFRPWIQGFRDYAFDHRPFDADQVQTQIKAAREFGSDGWMLWNPRNQYEQAFTQSSTETQ